MKNSIYLMLLHVKFLLGKLQFLDGRFVLVSIADFEEWVLIFIPDAFYLECGGIFGHEGMIVD
jgi:hypothetical protein